MTSDHRLVFVCCSAFLLVLLADNAVYGQALSCGYTEVPQTYPDADACDMFFKCANGTVTHEKCANGLLYSGQGSVHEHCDYYWRVQCENRPVQLEETRDGSCPYSFGLFPAETGCVDYFVKCAYGEVQPELCAEGLAYDERNHVCNWPDLVPTCSDGDAEYLVGYSCPKEIPANSASLRFGQFPRFATGQCDRLVICVRGFPRLVKCDYGKAVDGNSLTCVDAELVPECSEYIASV